MKRDAMEDRAGDLMALAQSIKDDVMASMQSSMPGIIRSFDPDVQTADVQVAIRRRVRYKDGIREEADALITDVPVCFLGGGNTSLTFPVSAGDECLVFFADRCIDAWFQSGGVQNQILPRMHDLSDGFALVGFRSKRSSLKNFAEDVPNFTGGLTVDRQIISKLLIGSIYTSTIDVSPELLQGGTWEALTPQTLFGETVYAWKRTH